MARLNIPGLREAVERQDLVRDAAFIVDRESIAGVAVTPLTLRQLVALKATGNPFVTGGAPEAVDVAAFLWLVSPGYSPRAKLRRWFFVRSLRHKSFLKLVEGIYDYLSDSFMDAPGNGKNSKSYFSIAAGLVGLLASEYSWTERDILNLPIKRALQYRNEIQSRKNPESILFNPSDRLVGEYLNQIAHTKN